MNLLSILTDAFSLLHGSDSDLTDLLAKVAHLSELLQVGKPVDIPVDITLKGRKVHLDIKATRTQ